MLKAHKKQREVHNFIGGAQYNLVDLFFKCSKFLVELRLTLSKNYSTLLIFSDDYQSFICVQQSSRTGIHLVYDTGECVYVNYSYQAYEEIKKYFYRNV